MIEVGADTTSYWEGAEGSKLLVVCGQAPKAKKTFYLFMEKALEKEANCKIKIFYLL